MKRKILFLALIVCSLISVFAISVFANETATEPKEPGLNIEAANLSFEDSVYVLYAVSHEGIPAESVKLLFWTEPEATVDAYVLGTEAYSKTYVDLDETVNGKSCVIFNNTELRAKNMADYVYARAYAVVDGVEYYSNVSKYSILQYAYNKLGYTGTESTNTALKNMLVSMLQYGAYAQTYFDHNTSRLANKTYYQIKVVGGLLEDGFTKGLYHAEEFATLTAPAAEPGFEFAGWKNSAGEIVSTANPLTLTDFSANETFTATYEKEELKYSEGLSYTLSSDKTYYIVYGIGTCTDTNVIIPETYRDLPVKEIASKAFQSNLKIKSITIPKNVCKLGDRAFFECKNLEKIYFNAIEMEDLSTYANCVFYDAGINTTGISVIVGKNVTKIPTALFYPNSSSNHPKIKNVQFEENSVCTSIGDQAFGGCTELMSVNIPESMTTLGFGAFSSCSNLTSIEITKNIKSIGNGAFSGCYRLVEVVNNSSFEIVKGSYDYGYVGKYALEIHSGESKLEFVQDFVFYSCDGVNYLVNRWGNSTEIVLPDYYQGSNYNIHSYAFYNCSNIKSVILGEGVDYIGESAFSGCTSISNILISKNVKNIASNAFYSCTALEKIYFNATAMEDLTQDGKFGNAGSGANGIVFVIGNNVTRIPKNLFYSSSYLEKKPKIIDLQFEENSVCTSIGDYSFMSCIECASLTIPDSVISIGVSAFGGSQIENLVIGKGVTSIGKTAFSGNESIKYLYIPNNVQNIGYESFGNCFNLVDIYIGEGVTDIGKNAFINCNSLETIRFNAIEMNDMSSTYQNYIFKDAGIKGDGIKVIIGNKVTRIPIYMFCPDSNINSNPPKITSVEFEQNSVCKSIGNSAFSGCIYLESIEFPDSLETINGQAFAACRNLKHLDLSNVITIGSHAFSGCDSLVEIKIPASVNSIGDYAFRRLSSLEKIYFYPSNIEKMSSVFESSGYSGAGIKLIVGKNVISIPDNMFYSYTSNNTPRITCVEFETGSVCEKIGSSAFQGCYELNCINIPDSVTTIGYSAFRYCSALENLTIPSCLKTLGSYAFQSCRSIKTIYFNAIEMDALSSSNCVFNDAGIETNGIKLIVGRNVIKIPDCLFESTAKVTDILFEEGTVCETIGYAAFRNNPYIITITIPETITSIGPEAFLGCYKLVEVYNLSTLDVTKGSVYNGYVGYNALSIHTSVEAETNIFVTNDGFIFYEDSEKCYLMGYNGDENEITLPESFNGKEYEIFKYAFYRNFKITSVIIPDTVYSLGLYSFYGCTNLLSVGVGNGIKCISSFSFMDCTNLTNVTLGEDVAVIDSYALRGCTNLVSMIIPKSVIEIDMYAFYNCSSFAIVYYGGSVEEWDDISTSHNNNPLTEATIYFYSETAPTTEGNFWHYNENGEIVHW